MAAFTPGTPIETADPAIAVEGLPAGSHTFRLVVVDEDGNASLPADVDVLVVDPAPVVDSFSPAFGRPGTAVAIAGSNLASSATQVFFGSVPATVTSVSPTSVGTNVPAGAVTAPIRVQTPKGTAASARAFIVPSVLMVPKLPAPVDADFDPFGKEIWVTGNSTATAAAAVSYAAAVSLDGKITGMVTVGRSAGDIAVSRNADRRVGLVANLGSSSVTLISLSDRKVLHVFQLKADPDGVAVTPDGTRGAVAIPATGQVVVLDLVALQSVGELQVGRLPSKLVLAQAGKLGFVNCLGTGNVVGIDLRKPALVGAFAVGGGELSRPVQLTATPAGFPVWTANEGASSASEALSAAKVNDIKLDFKPGAVAADDAAKRAYLVGPASDILAVIESGGTEAKPFQMIAPGGSYKSVAALTDARLVAVAHPQKAAVSVFNAGARLQAVLDGFKAPSRIIATDDDAFFCVLDPAADAVALISCAGFT